jgi:hypothetical protein
MVVKLRMSRLLAGTVLGTCVIALPAFAQDAQNQQKMQNEINSLQQQLQTLQSEIAQNKQVPAGVYNQAPLPGAPMVTKGAPAWFDSIHVSMAGSFIAMEGVWRDRNEVASGATDTPFSSMPFSNSPLYHENELGFTAQQSRIQLEAKGDIDPAQHLLAHFEMDFLGSGVTGNSRESDSYNLRIRQLFAEYDNDNAHFHFKAGQQWSLLTQERVGMMQNENVPLTIDAQYVAGFNWARQPSIRFVEDWNKVAWFGVSVEAPQTNFQSNSIGIIGATQQTASTTGTGLNPTSVTVGSTSIGGATAPPGMSINNINGCQASGLLDSTTGCSVNNYPDIIEKFAVDPGWGHYEAIGLQRFFTDRVFETAIPGSGSNMTTFGWGVGGNALMPVWPKIVDLQGSVMYGAGLGRYGSSQLPDVTIGSNGALTPLQTLQFLVGAVAHPLPALDIYAYYGQEQIQSNFWNITSGGKTTNGGYGNPAFANTGCLLENQASGPAGFNDPIPGTSCSGASNVQKTQEITAGFWYNVYQGDLGRVRFGMQYEYFTLTAFGTSPTPASVLVSAATTGQGAIHTTPNQGLNPNNQAVFFSIRYYPFN